MINKLYEKIKKLIKENYGVLLTLIIIYFLVVVELPFTISKPGGVINTEEKVEISSNLNMEGSLNMAYVSQLPSNSIFLLLSSIIKDWDIEKNDNEFLTTDEEKEINKLMLNEANNDAYVVALEASNIPYSKEDNKIYVTYIEQSADTDLEVGDQIIKIDNKTLQNREEIQSLITKKEEGEEIEFTVINKGEEKVKKARVTLIEGEPKVGMLLYETYKIKTERNVEFNFKNSESGGSGGLMMALTLYSYLNNEDLTKGKKIVGTGSIDSEGNVGEISGVKYKILGAEKENADIFLVAKGNNYKDARRIKNERNLDIEIVSIETFDEALTYLKNME